MLLLDAVTMTNNVRIRGLQVMCLCHCVFIRHNCSLLPYPSVSASPDWAVNHTTTPAILQHESLMLFQADILQVWRVLGLRLPPTDSCMRTPSITSMPDFLLSCVFLILHPSQPQSQPTHGTYPVWITKMKSVTWQFIHPNVGRLILDFFNNDFMLRRFFTATWCGSKILYYTFCTVEGIGGETGGKETTGET
jgi:hypothetical protein